MKKNNTKAIARPIFKPASIAKFAFLVSVATLVPLLGQQFLTGPMVNAVIFIAVVVLGVEGAVLVGITPSLIALSIGLLPAVLAPMIPFIILGNVLLALTFFHFKKYNFWVGVASASLVKFVFLFASSSVVIDLVLKKEIAAKVATIMSWPQLLTALAGGLVAYGFLKIVKRLN